ncbi:Myosin heavy chain-related protein [Parasponia andersonii]|uniref:Myosin heavy chain-related protein n=1 Tax=Parasponia andersonii TaxID=3476 RepID=A0A2P5DMP6_PARAD|nr:Myosin heavy chain-related protein [Parasponia andersonii]
MKKMEIDNNNGFSKTLNPTPLCKSQIRPLRVADILGEEEDEDEEEEYGGCKALQNFDMNGIGSRRRDCSSARPCSSPRRIIARFLAALWPARERKLLVGTQKREEEVGELGGGSVHTTCSMNVPSGCDSHIPGLESQDSGRCRRESRAASFNLGIACGLLYLIGASKNEITKMVEVRKQVEILLQNIRDELQKNDSPFKPSQPSDYLAYSINNFRESSNSHTQHSPQTNFMGTTSYVIPESETILQCNGSTECTMHEVEQECRLAEMDELEAELEAELELLQLHLDTKNPIELPQQQRLTVKAVVEVIDPQEVCTEELHTGVRPIELERKLHELLELRQQERIKELEDALECAKQKLGEKEAEVSWWKDTARLISQHIPERSRTVFQHYPETFHSLR